MADDTDKNKMESTLRWSRVLSGAGRFSKSVADTLLVCGAAMLVMSLFAVIAPEAGLAAIAGGAMAFTASAGADYAAKRMWNSGRMEHLEANAQTVARQRVQELWSRPAQPIEGQHGMGRSDGRSWVATVTGRQMEQEQLENQPQQS